MYYRAYRGFARWKRKFIKSDQFILFEDVIFMVVLPIFAALGVTRWFPEILETLDVRHGVFIMAVVGVAWVYITVMKIFFDKAD